MGKLSQYAKNRKDNSLMDESIDEFAQPNFMDTSQVPNDAVFASQNFLQNDVSYINSRADSKMFDESRTQSRLFDESRTHSAI